MAVDVHVPHPQQGRPGRHGRVGRQPALPGRQPALPGPQPRGRQMQPRGLAVWVMPGAGADIEAAVMARAAELLRERARNLAPEAEVLIRPASGASTSGVGDSCRGGTPLQDAGAGNPPLSGSQPGSEPAGQPLQPPGNRRPEAASDGGAAADGEAASDGGTPAGQAVQPPVPLAGRRSRMAVDLAADTVLLDGEPVPLTAMEYKLLRYLVENCSRAISREELQRLIESLDCPGAAFRSIDVYVGRVRRKLGSARHAVATVRGGGYQFVPGPNASVRGPAEYSI